MVPKDQPDDRLDINRASQEEIARIGAVDWDMAGEIVRYRDALGRLEGPEDLARIPGVGEQTAQQIARQVHFF
jgi:competence ComEA-like helix-hairpin-helix protein